MPLGHVIAAHRATGMSVVEIVRRLDVYSFDLRHVARDLPPLAYQDQFLVSVKVNGEPPWLDRDDEIGLGHVLLAAFKRRLDVSVVFQRLTDLGFRVAPVERWPDRIAAVPAEFAEEVLSKPVPLQDGVVSRAWTVELAAEWRLPPREVARRMKDLGFEPPSDDELPTALDERDVLLLEDLIYDVGNQGVLTASLGHVFSAAERAECEPSVAAERLSALGFAVTPVALLTRVFDDVDRWLAENIERCGDPSRAASMFITMIEAAREFEKPLPDIAERLRGFGYDPPDVGHLPEPVSGLDHHLLRPGGGRIGELGAGEPVPLAFVVQAAQNAGWSVQAAWNQLVALGFSVVPAEPPGAGIDAVSVDLADKLDLDEAVSVRDVLLAALAHTLTIGEVVRRLIHLGLGVPDMATELSKLLQRVPFEPGEP